MGLLYLTFVLRNVDNISLRGRLVHGLSKTSPVFSPRKFLTGSLVGEVALVQVFLSVLRLGTTFSISAMSLLTILLSTLRITCEVNRKTLIQNVL